MPDINFPRQISRGPIEASGRLSGSLLTSSFRDRSVAAPLKR